MDYVVGSIAALISGNVTPNRPKLIRRALTPTKHPSSPNVTPKSEFVEDRSIFLSPSVQKKKAIVKKSPKRIFENPDLDLTENGESSSPKADKVKKVLKNALEADEMGKSSILSKKSPSNNLEKSLQSDSPVKKSKINDSQVSNENTPKKKKRKSETEVSATPQAEKMDIDQNTPVAVENTSKSPKKMKQRCKSVGVDNAVDETEEVTKAADKNYESVSEPTNTQDGKKKKNKKRKTKNKQANQVESNKTDDQVNKLATESKTIEANTETKSAKKKKNRKNKNKKAKTVETPTETKEVEENAETPKTIEVDQSDDENEEITNNDSEDKEIIKDDEESDNEDESDNESEEVTQEDDNDSDSDEEISNIPNPNAITANDTDSEHDSDDEIESENEEINKDALKTDNADESSDDEEEAKTKKGTKKKKKEVAQKEDKQDKTEGEKEVDTEEEIKRTLFVGNVPFSNKCKKEIKKIFAPYGDIETVRIRTVPVKDARVTPKLAVIKNEIHPDRSTVNVYVKFADPNSVELALAENNRVLNHHHLRVSRSGATGVEHDPNRAVFLGNLPFGIEDETLRAKFDKCGEIDSVRIVRDKKTNAGKGFGYVNFASKDGVELALGLSEEDLTVKNRIIRVKRCTQTLSKGPKNASKSMKPGPRKDFGNNQGQNRNFGNNSGQNRNFGGNQGQRGNHQGPNRNFGNNQRSFGNNQGQNRNFGNNQGPNRSFGNNQGPSRNFGNSQGPNRSFGNNQGPRNFGNNQNKFGNQGNNEGSGASRRIMNKRPHQESGDGPPNKKQDLNQPREKKQRKEFVGMTAEKKKKQKFDKGQKKKKAISEIMTKNT